MLNIIKFVGKVLFVAAVVVISIYLVYTLYAAMDFLNIGADGS